jgi:hypothetical protein
VRNSADGVFRLWTASRWSLRTGASRDFTMSADGKMRVPEAGVYLLYAQVRHPLIELNT